MLNRLYGFFGRKSTYIKQINDCKNDSIITELINDVVLIREDTPYDIKESNLANLAIACAITSYSRIHMHKFLFVNNNDLYYSDTDSVILSKPLNESDINNKIGGFKTWTPHF